ncbi:MAG: hypothetical protein Q7J64_00480 [Elusimicrobiota bacterium]|nr:hypothetical protein [Elusimicrobiota bacterium]
MSLLTELRDRALKRPWLLAPPLLGLLGQNMLLLLSPGAPGAMALKTLLAALMTAAVTALFAELWLGDGWSVAPKKLAGTWNLFLLPYPLLLVFGFLTTPLVYWLLHAELSDAFKMGGISFVLGLGKLAAFFLGAVSAIAACRRAESSGALGALLLGVRTVAANAGFFFLTLTGLWIFQEACVFLARTLAPGPLAGLITTVIPLLGAVALPIEAWRSGRLSPGRA